MRRDQSYLYTGVSSAVQRNETRKAEQRRSKAESTRRELLPAGERLIAMIDKEIAEVGDIMTFIVGANSTQKEVKEQLLAKKMNVEFLRKFKSAVNTILRESPKTTRKEGGDES